jgi:hypothetical protein
LRKDADAQFGLLGFHAGPSDVRENFEGIEIETIDSNMNMMLQLHDVTIAEHVYTVIE